MFALRFIPFMALVIATSSASKILMVIPLGSASHKNIFTPIAQKMGEKGHDVTILSMYSSESTRPEMLSYKDVVASKARKTVQSATGEFNVFKMHRESQNVNSQVMRKVLKHMPEYCDAFLRDPAVESVWNVKPDLIMLPAFMNECGLAFVHKFQVPFIYVTTSGLTPWTADIMGTPEHPAYVPNQYLPFSDDMTLLQRVVNSVARVVSPLARQLFVLNRMEKVVGKFLGDDNISFKDLERNTSVVLVNSHHSLGYPRPLSPNVIEVGGMQCRQAKNLENIDPKLNTFLNEAGENGAILFSLGSHIKSSQMPEDVLGMFVNVFNRLPYEVVWKWEGERPANLSSNVLTRTWLPQQDVLGHPSTGAFFTHGGLLSLQETAYHGVPIVALPLMSDQPMNAKQAVALGMAVSLDLKTLTEANIEEAILRIMNNPSYRQEAHRRSSILKDQETHPLDRAVYWSEYVIRHRGASHLRPAASKLSTLQYYLVDVAVVICILTIIMLFIVFCFLKLSVKAASSSYSFVNILTHSAKSEVE